jgi:hypothetical protein
VVTCVDVLIDCIHRPEDGSLTSETCRQFNRLPSRNNQLVAFDCV